MIKEIKEMKEIISHQRYCDSCGEIIGSTYNKCKCCFCNKDICLKCQAYTKYDDEYAVTYCQSCWDKGEKYKHRINKAEKLIEKLYRQWKADCI